MPHRVTAESEVVTPLFLGGADPARTVELRAPSIKGVLRFSWRALAWSRLDGNLEAIRSEEALLFGIAAREGDASSRQVQTLGHASFRIRIPSPSQPNVLNPKEDPEELEEQRDRPGRTLSRLRSDERRSPAARRARRRGN
jgi:CRISPR type III-B/RAMP module RAMP protein Cmr1